VRAVLAKGLARPLVAIALFEFGNCATTLLILRATGLLHHGARSLVAATSLAILLYAANNLLGAVVALGGGRWIDRGGPRLPFAGGAFLFACSYAIFALGPHGWLPLLAAFVLSGSGIGLAETAESTLVATHLPDGLRGSGFGLLGGLQAAGDLAASVMVGLIWSVTGPGAAFLYASAWMVASLIASALVVPPGQSV
jgi:MFS family permease